MFEKPRILHIGTLSTHSPPPALIFRAVGGLFVEGGVTERVCVCLCACVCEGF